MMEARKGKKRKTQAHQDNSCVLIVTQYTYITARGDLMCSNPLCSLAMYMCTIWWWETPSEILDPSGNAKPGPPPIYHSKSPKSRLPYDWKRIHQWMDESTDRLSRKATHNRKWTCTQWKKENVKLDLELDCVSVEHWNVLLFIHALTYVQNNPIKSKKRKFEMRMLTKTLVVVFPFVPILLRFWWHISLIFKSWQAGMYHLGTSFSKSLE